MPRLESNLQSKIFKSARSTFHVRYMFKLHTCNKNGVPDVFLAVPGFGCVFMEIKRSPKDKPRANQIGFINRLNAFGCRATVISCWDDWWSLRDEILRGYDSSVRISDFIDLEKVPVDKSKSPLESSVQARIISSINSMFGPRQTSFKIISASINGVPDLFMTIDGIGPVFVELKRDEGCDPRVNQKGAINILRLCGVKAYAARSWSEWIDLAKLLNTSVINA